jgi:PleD family two-component response regulator
MAVFSPMPRRVLLVEPHARSRKLFSSMLAGVADVDTCHDFLSARRTVCVTPYDVLVTQVRLGLYNGLHLAYLARPHVQRRVVYAPSIDLIVAREAQLAGAFYETAERIPLVLLHYVTHALPSVDRRDPGCQDRRHDSRGGRRVTDVTVMHAR